MGRRRRARGGEPGISVVAPGIAGEGDAWSASWRWWNNRPAVSVGLAAPRVSRLPGVWRFEGSWESDTYRVSPSGDMEQSRIHGGLGFADWITGNVRYRISTGLDAWSDGRKSVSIGGTLERVAFADRLSVSIDAVQWAPINGGVAFGSIGARALVRSSADTRGWVARATAGVERVGDAAPLTLWPGAGEGQVRSSLLRAHPLLTDGVVDLTGSSAFGRTLVSGSAELQHWFERPALVRVGLAGFVDAAHADRRAIGGARSSSMPAAGSGSGFPAPPVCFAPISHTASATARTR